MNKPATIIVFLLSEFVFGFWPIIRYGMPQEQLAQIAVLLTPWIWWFGRNKTGPLVKILLVPTLWLIGIAHLLVDGLSGLDVLVATLTLAVYVLVMMLVSTELDEPNPEDVSVIWTPNELVDSSAPSDARLGMCGIILCLCLAPLYAADVLITEDVLLLWANQANRVQACTLLLLSIQGAFAVDMLLDKHLRRPSGRVSSWLLGTGFSLLAGVAWSFQ